MLFVIPTELFRKKKHKFICPYEHTYFKTASIEVVRCLLSPLSTYKYARKCQKRFLIDFRF